MRLPRRGTGKRKCGCSRNNVPITVPIAARDLQPGMAFVDRDSEHKHSRVAAHITDVVHGDRTLKVWGSDKAAQFFAYDEQVRVTW